MAHRIYQLKVSLQGTAPPIWRRILVSANLTLRQASGVLQKAMGWEGALDYCYRQDGREFGRYRDDSVYLEDDTMFSLRYCLCVPGHTLEYAYGPWRHLIELEKITEAEGRFPWRLVERAGETPPERCLLGDAPLQAVHGAKVRH